MQAAYSAGTVGSWVIPPLQRVSSSFKAIKEDHKGFRILWFKPLRFELP
jgi:hypothetical protein